MSEKKTEKSDNKRKCTKYKKNMRKQVKKLLHNDEKCVTI